MRIVLEIFFFLILVFASASKCPETKKPHVSSCVIFYNCVNLPEGGYVWAPSRCAEGLVFQPSLRLCVLPGDSWNCDDAPDRSSANDQTFPTSQLVDRTKSSYDGLITDDMLYSIDLSHKIDNSNLGNTFNTHPYPLIEIDSESDTKKEDHKLYPDASLIPAKRLGNNSLELNHGQEYVPVTLIKVKDVENENKPNFESFMNRIFLYQHFAPSLKQQTFVSSPYINRPAFTSNKPIDNNKLRYLIENYFLDKKTDCSKPINPNGIIIKVEPITKKIEIDEMQSGFMTTEKNVINVENIDEKNNILAIIGNLGRKEYVTVEKYKSWSDIANVEILKVIKCTLAHRLSNSTDCMRYYTCNPTTAEVHEFICPPNTAFNNQINLCDTQKYKSCKEKQNSMQSGRIQIKNKLQEIVPTNVFEDRETFSAVKLCETTGKFPDTSSDKFYYLCYSSKTSGKIESFRMVCPNHLIFCPNKQMCTTKQLCSNSE